MKKNLAIIAAVAVIALLLHSCEFSHLTDIFSPSKPCVEKDVESHITVTTGELITITTEEVQELPDAVMIGESIADRYDRGEWTSSYQWYECLDDTHDHETRDGYAADDGGEFRSIRAYGYYESIWFDWETMLYQDPYTGKTVDGVDKCDYDHIVPLAYVNAHGGCNWGEETKKAFADDPSVGVCCNGHDNRVKGAKGPSEWLPEVNQAAYCYTFLKVCVEHGLTVSQEDFDVFRVVLENAVDGEIFIINQYVK